MNLVKTFKYLGRIISKYLTIKQDIERCERSFWNQFHSIFRKFSFANEEMLGYLFKTRCLSFFGAEMWHDTHASIGAFRSIAISYHKAIKRILKMSYRESNHTACEFMQCLVFKHFVNTKIISFAFQIMNSKSACLMHHRAYLETSSTLLINVERLAEN